MSDTVRVCANCKSVHLHRVLNRTGLKPLYFCSLKCENEYLITKLQEKDNEKEDILPEVRIFTARKTDKGVTVVRGEGGFQGRSAQEGN